MVKVRGPLFSHQASGSIGNGTLQFRATKTGAQVILPGAGKQTGKRPPSNGQAETRATFRQSIRNWKSLSPSSKAIWNENGVSQGYSSGYALFMARGFDESRARWAILVTPSGETINTPRGLPLSI